MAQRKRFNAAVQDRKLRRIQETLAELQRDCENYRSARYGKWAGEKVFSDFIVDMDRVVRGLVHARLTCRKMLRSAQPKGGQG